ncbi:MAG: DUF4339 domain-containing protein, partial [Candidatus Sumerlaeota bacterium]|nr:DUF4339 domain-containing protein [Candidatus Sumerlaeota bacterium]
MGEPGNSAEGRKDPRAGGPLPASPKEWFAAMGGQRYGPFTREEVAAMAQTGRINSSVLVWKQGMPAWSAPNAVPELSFLRFPAPAPRHPSPAAPETGRRSLAIPAAVAIVVVIAGFWWWRSHSGAASSPDKAFVQMVHAVAENRPAALWDSLPPSYQRDVRDVVAEFADAM